MKPYIRKCLAVMLSACSLTVGAQDFNTAYFNSGHIYRHQMNPAMDNDSTTYVSVPVVGNIGASLHGDINVKDVIFDNPMYPETSGHKYTTFMNPYIPVGEALSGFSSGDNRLITDMKVGFISAGWRGWRGYNTFDINLRAQAGLSLPYELFEFAKNTGNKHYDIGDLSMRAQSFIEVGFGHSRDLNKKLRVGAKLKILLGVGRMDLAMKGITADLSSNEKWIIKGDAQADVSLKGFTYETETKEYNATNETYEHISDIDVDSPGLNGFGLAVDLGATYKLMKNLTLSAALCDLGFISWANDWHAENKAKQFEFSGFHDIDVHKETVGGNGTIGEQGDKYSDQLADFINLQDCGDKGSRTTGIGATMRLGAEYVLPKYDKLSFGLLNTTRIQGDYSWTEFRASANWRPTKLFSASASAAAGSFGATLGWLLNVRGLFFGMDYLLGSLNSNGVPLKSNVSAHIGFNVWW